MSSVVKGVKNIVGGITGSSGAKAADQAANIQANAANQASQQQMQMFEQLRKDLGGYAALGSGSQNALLQAMGFTPTFKDGKLTGLTQNKNAQLQKQFQAPGAFKFGAQDLANTPGYQFALQQGLKAGQNSAAARGLGLSGAQLKGAQQYATGLADQTYGDQYQRALDAYNTNYNTSLSAYNTNYQTAANNVNNLLQLLQAGQNAAAQTGVAGLNAANTAGGYLTSGANALAAGKIGQASAYQNSPLMQLGQQAAGLYTGSKLGLFG